MNKPVKTTTVVVDADKNSGKEKKRFTSYVAGAVAGASTVTKAAGLVGTLLKADDASAESPEEVTPVDDAPEAAIVEPVQAPEAVAADVVAPEAVAPEAPEAPEPAKPVAGPEPEIVEEAEVAEAVVETPAEEADEVVAHTEIDPADIDMADVFVYDSLGHVYDDKGEAFTAASFHDPATGQQMVMVDVDGDNAFDIITDCDGNMIAGISSGITVDDVEMGLSQPDAYLAHGNAAGGDDFGTESIDQDMIS